MYIRFVSPLRGSRRGVHYGLFQAIIAARELDDYPSWLRNEVEREFDWFKHTLPSPHEKHFPDIYVRARADHICWFHSEANEMIKRAHGIRLLLRECGLSISILKTIDPGRIVYSDAYQIVARPSLKTPISWH